MSKLAKQRLVVIVMFLALVVATSGFIVANQSVAWFARNHTVSGSGMSVKAEVTPNLVIAKSENEIRNMLLETADSPFSVSFADSSHSDMLAATRDGLVGESYLKYIDNPIVIDFQTGKIKEGAAADYETVPLDANSRFYVDYTVYLASARVEMTLSSLKLKITSPAAADLECHKAISIDCYIGDTTESGYLGTLSLAEALSDPDAGIEILESAPYTLPINSDGYIKVIMRAYFDGALINSETGNAYVNSASVEADNLSLGVSFVATEA